MQFFFHFSLILIFKAWINQLHTDRIKPLNLSVAQHFITGHIILVQDQH